MNSLKIAMLQVDIVWENPQINLSHYDKLIKNIDNDTDIIILPEVFDTGFSMVLDNISKPIGHKSFQWMQNTAKKQNSVVVGSVLYEENRKNYNRMFWVFPNGDYQFYNKRHLFQMGGEDTVISQGKERVVVFYKGLKFMLQICYDLRFPVWVKNRYNTADNTYDYDVLIYIANWPEIRKPAYMTLLKARAIENQAYVIWVNRIGKNNNGIAHTGDTQVIDPEGNIITKMPENKKGILYTDLKTDTLKTIRQSFKTAMDWDNFLLKK